MEEVIKTTEQVRERTTTVSLTDVDKKIIDKGIIMEDCKNRTDFIRKLIDEWDRKHSPNVKLKDILRKEEKLAKELSDIKAKRKDVAVIVKWQEKKIKAKQFKIIKAIKILKNKIKTGNTNGIDKIAEYWANETGKDKDTLLRIAKK